MIRIRVKTEYLAEGMIKEQLDEAEARLNAVLDRISAEGGLGAMAREEALPLAIEFDEARKAVAALEEELAGRYA